MIKKITLLVTTLIFTRCSSLDIAEPKLIHEATFSIDSTYKETSVDARKLKSLIQNNYRFLDTWAENIYLEEFDRDKMAQDLDQYKVISYEECGQFQHWCISKTRRSERDPGILTGMYYNY